MVHRAIRQFESVAYHGKELIIIDDSPTPLDASKTAAGDVRYVWTNHRLTVGAKRNLACALARGELIAHFDDDDWYAPDRLTVQVASLEESGAQLSGTSVLYYADTRSASAWQYRSAGPLPWLSMLCYRRSFWSAHPFEDRMQGSDTLFVRSSMPEERVELPRHDLCVCFIHDDNVSPKRTDDGQWHPVSFDLVQRIVGADSSAFGLAPPPAWPSGAHHTPRQRWGSHRPTIGPQRPDERANVAASLRPSEEPRPQTEWSRARTDPTPGGETFERQGAIRPGRDPWIRAPHTEAVHASLASVPWRREQLRRVTESLLSQVDRLRVFLNGYEDVPRFLRSPKIDVERSQDHGDLGDAGKFFWSGRVQGYHLTCDDDILYPPDYVARAVAEIEANGRTSAIGFHGSRVLPEFTDYYDDSSRRIYGYESAVGRSTPVHILGTGCLAYHTDTIQVRREDFCEPNMADVWFALLGQRQRVPFLVSSHRAGWIRTLPGTQTTSIWSSSSANDRGQLDTRERQTRLVLDHMPWRLHRDRLRVLLIGRVGDKWWSKGGVARSAALIEEALRARGDTVTAVAVDEPLGPLDGSTDLAWIYPGGPSRPDFALVNRHVELLCSTGIPVLVQCSYDGDPARSAWIREFLQRWPSNVTASVFSDAATMDTELAAVRRRVMTVPKTLSYFSAAGSHGDRQGIFLGDVEKLASPTISPGAGAWVDALRKALPTVPLLAVRQYGGRSTVDGVTELAYDRNLGRRLSGFRFYVSLCTTATFEMVPLEAQATGCPVIYRPMPQSLSEWIGPTGVRVRSPDELAGAARRLYLNPGAWQDVSQAGRLNAQSKAVGLIGEVMRQTLLNLVATLPTGD